ncbi:MAG: aminotransferase class V-fold PLP-dependent enzyme, partial [Myxococcota bacterium]|nr:aminotransferase class V-fold PLP-dependent enzyme [Myxococcota bacterium]
DRVVLFEGEFPANVTPWQRAAHEHDLKLRFLSLEPYGDAVDEAMDLLEEALRGGVRLVAVSAVQFQTGLRMPVGEMARLCHQHGAQIFVDGIQACGASPLDVHDMDIDYLATGGHKWLMGPTGVGFLYVSPSRVEHLRPVAAGWMSHEDGMGFLFDGPGHMRYDRPIRRRADLLESGMPNVLGCSAAEAALELIQQLGVSAIYDHVQQYIDALESALVARGFKSLRAGHPGGRSTLLCTRPPEGVDVVELHKGLVGEGVDCSIPDGRLRFAPHWPNHLDEVPAVAAAVDRLIP